ncbi:MAG: topoisomerase DNA-binding C4 zinc finger domain-containing protein, partial [Ignavibacteriales bacterium]|nr:topoisomerase DNA-binding C4 zinc finger domain-containing protein [Ignavibacteriales bacterium]
MFVYISKEEFENVLLNIHPGFKLINIKNTNELVYEAPIKNIEYLKVRVYSTLEYDVKTKKYISRDYGKDAIRVMLFDYESQHFIGGKANTKRITGWQDRLKEKILEIATSVSGLICKNCGSYLVIRKSKEGNEFLGCINYPN